MSKINELIEKLCPNGVKYIELKEVCTFNRGTPITSKIAKNGNIPVISGGQKPAFYHNIANRPENTITIAGSGAYAGYVNFWKEPIFCSDAFSVDIINENILNKRYLYHFLLNNQDKIYSKKVGAGIPHVYGKDIANFFIPIPPLEIQCEIVRILDKFTELIALLKAELKARQKQYAYYREHLLTFGDEIPRKKLIDIATISRGKRVTKQECNDNEKYPVYQNSLAPMGYYQEYNYEKNKTYVISAGSAGEIGFSEENFWAADDCLVIYDLEEVLDKYIYYYLMLKQENIRSNVRKASIPRLPKKIIENIEIPILPIEKQKEIVLILDKFDKLCNSLAEGIPAEIEARQKQYEYYRDNLLTFKALEIKA